MTQQRLFRLAVEALVMNATYEPGQGWSLRCAERRQGEPWADECWTEYAGLTTSELLQVLSDHFGSRL